MEGTGPRRRRTDLVNSAFTATSRPLLIVDPAGQLAAASRGAGVLLGEDPEALVGRRLADMLVPPEVLSGCRREAGCGGQPVSVQVRAASGNLVPVEVRCESFVAPPLAQGEPADGDVRYCLLLMSDVRRREHEAELRAVRLAKLSLLNQVSEALYDANLTLEQVLQAVLICVTAGEGLRFNRAFLLLVDDARENLRGELAIGPSSREEASRIWQNLAGERSDLFEMMTTYDRSVKQTDVVVNEIVQRMVIPLEVDDHFLVRAMQERHTLRAVHDLPVPGVADVAGWLGCGEFAVAPLTTRSGSLGVILADNAISGEPINALDLEFLQMFANQSASAIENSRLYHELERRLLDLRRAHQKQREDQEMLLRMERLSVMGETAAVVAHELRNPLVAIGGFARSLERGLPAGDPNREFARIIVTDVDRMETIIGDLLDFIRPQKPQRTDVVVDQLVAETVDQHQERITAAGVTLRYDLQAGEDGVPCHPGEIQQVLENYLTNALQASPTGGTIVVSSRVLPGGLRVAVADDGPGFAEDIADMLHTPFFSTKPTGTGLGLTICAQIIKGHGGVTEALNRAEGGAEFAFILPFPRGDEEE